MHKSNEFKFRQWVPVICLSFAAFIFVTTEMLPVGLLPDIAASFQMSEASTGLLLTVYAWMVALMSLPLTILSARMDRKKLVLLLLFFFTVGNILSALSVSFYTLMGARICIALCHAVFWSIATPLAVRIAPETKKAKALSLVVAGGSVAMVLGVPVGTILGHQLGWRAAFAVIAGFSACIFFLMLRLLSPQPSTNSNALRSLPLLFRRPQVIRIYTLILLVVLGHFTLVTYFTPYMVQVGGFSKEFVAMLLLVLGGSGIVGSIIGGKYMERHPKAMFIAPLCLMLVCLVAMPLVKFGWPSAVLLCFFWGTSMTCASLILQHGILKAASDSADVAVSIFSGTFNIGIGGGALLGSNIFALAGVGWTAYAGAAFVLVALGFAVLWSRIIIAKP